jgi:drug/metabolite transporter (DMT)-like permease
MAVGMAGFTMNDTITKAVSSEMNFGQVMLVRGVFAIALIAALAWHQGALRPLRTLMMKPVALRVAGEVGGTVSFLAAIVHLPLANTAAIFQALPLAITLGAALIFGEPVGWRRWLAITAGLSAFSSSCGRGRRGLISFRCSRWFRSSSARYAISRPSGYPRQFRRCSSRY